MKLPSISYVVARSVPGDIIGNENRLPWHLRTDLQRFKDITYGHPIIMGRKTHLSIGRPLPGRVNIVLSRTHPPTRQNSFWHKADTSVVWAGDLPSALFFADVSAIAKNQSEFFVIGGAEMYSMFFNLFNRIHLTEVLTSTPILGDAKFDFKADLRKWKEISHQNYPSGPQDDFPSRYRILDRKRKCIRYVIVNDYFTDRQNRDVWVNTQLDLFETVRRAHSDARSYVVPYQYKLFEEREAA